MAKDLNLEISGALPAAGANTVIGPLDLQVNAQVLSDQWRLGRLRVSLPACPNCTNASTSIRIALQDTADGANYANTTPNISVAIPGVASTGIPATTIDFPLPPLIRGPLQLFVAVDANGGNNTAVTLTADWLNE